MTSTWQSHYPCQEPPCTPFKGTLNPYRICDQPNSLSEGFRDEYPGGGIYRHQFEQWTGNTVMNIIFKLIIFFFIRKLNFFSVVWTVTPTVIQTSKNFTKLFFFSQPKQQSRSWSKLHFLFLTSLNRKKTKTGGHFKYMMKTILERLIKTR